MKPKFRSLIAAFAPLTRSSLIVCASLCAATSASADQTWIGATDAAWATLTNWSGGALPLTTEKVVFDATSTANLSAIALGANRTINGITFTSPATDVAIVAGSTLSFNGSGIDMSGATANLSIAAGVNLSASGQQNWSVASGRTLTLASLARTTSGGIGNVNVGASLTLPAAVGATKVGAVAIPVFADGQGNAFVTYGLDNWAGTDATGNVVGCTNTAWNASIGTVFQGPSVITGSFTQTGNGGASSILFNDTVTAHTLTLAAGTTFTGRGVMVASNSVGGTITGGNFRPNRVASGAGGNAPINFVQNSLLGDLRISNLSNGSSSTTVSLVKSGVGKLILTDGTFHTGGTFINGGTLQVGDGGLTGTTQSTSFVVMQSGTALVFNRTNTLAYPTNISGAGSFTQNGTGEVTLTTSVSTFTGPVNINAGTLAVTTLGDGVGLVPGNLGYGTAININGGAFKFLGVFDPTVRTVTIGSSGATFDTNGNAITFANAFNTGSTGAVTKNGTGSLTLATDNNYTGGTTVNGGTLIVNGATSSTGSGAVTVNSTATLGGSGKAAGAVTVASGGGLSPGSGGIGTLTVGSLNMGAGTNATFEFNNTPSNDAVTVTGGLTLNGGAITLLDVTGSPVAFTTPGTYNLISHSGATSGTGFSSLSVANAQPGFTYAFNDTGSMITLTIATAGVVSHWITDGNGSWPAGANWNTNPTVPNGSGQTAIFDKILTGASIVSLDGSKTVGAITLSSASFGYTIAPGSGGSITLNNGANPSAIATNVGIHTISADLALVSNTGLTTGSSAESLTLSGIVSGAGTLTKTGPGSLSLLNSNTFGSLLTLSGGSTSFANGGLGNGNLTISGASLVWAGSNTQDISNRTITFGSNPVSFDTNGNNVSLANAIGAAGTANFTKTGAGILAFASNPTYTGTTTISGGTLQLGTGGTTGLVTGSITDNGTLAVDLITGSTFSNVVTGTGSFVHSGTGVLTLDAANTFTGTTGISSGTGSLVLNNALSLQSSTLAYASSGGAFSFGTLTAATLGGLSGDKSLVLENTTPAAAVLTIGNNGQATSYSGALSGLGALTKVGAGISTLNGANVHTGGTNVNAGTLEIGVGGSITGAGVGVSTNGTLLMTGGSGLTASAIASFNNAGGSSVFSIVDGNAVLNAGVQALGNGNNGYRIQVDAGTLNTTTMTLGRGSLSFTTEALAIGSTTQGLYVNGGAVTITNALNMGTNTNTNSSVSTFVNSGSLTVLGKVTVGLNNGSRWSVLQVSGGTFTSSDTVDGVVLGGPFVGNAVFAVAGGSSTVEKIQFGQGALAGSSVLRLTGGELYVGAGGIQKTSVNNASVVRLAGGTLAAKAAWSTSLPISVTATSIIKAADVSDNPVNITLNGMISGIGGLTKTGTGTVTLSGGHTHTGPTLISAGTLSVTSRSFNDSAAIYMETGGTLNLNFSGADRVGSFYNDGGVMADGIYGRVGNTFGAIESTFITGDGLLYVNTAIPTTNFDTWAATPAFGLVAGLNDGPTQDPDQDGISNLIEYILNGNPSTSDLSILPQLVVTPTDFEFTYNRLDLSLADTTQSFQYGSDLGGWTAVVVPVGPGVSTVGIATVTVTDGATSDTVKVSIPKTAAVGGTLFGRLKAVK